MIMKISLYIFAVLINIFLNSCCNYIPFVDPQIVSDYKEVTYEIESYSYLIESDSLQIKVKASALIPTRCRSKRNKSFFVQLGFEIEKKFYQDTLTELDNNTQLLCNDDNTIIKGKSLNNGRIEPMLLIKHDNYFITADHLKYFRLEYLFNYKNVKEFKYSKHNLVIDFGMLTIGKMNVATKNIFGSLE